MIGVKKDEMSYGLKVINNVLCLFCVLLNLLKPTIEIMSKKRDNKIINEHDVLDKVKGIMTKISTEVNKISLMFPPN